MSRQNFKTIGIFSAQYPPHVGGVEAFTQNIAHTLASLGHRVVVITNDTENLGAGSFVEGDIEIVRLPCMPLISGRLPIPKFNPIRKELLNQLVQYRFDGILVNTRFYPHSLLGMSVAHRYDLRPLVLDHGSAWLSFSNPILDFFVRLYERAITAYGMFRYHPAYFGISKKSSEWLFNFRINSSGEIHNSIDSSSFRALSSGRDFRSEFNIPNNSFVVGFIGRFIPEKGIDALIEASKNPDLVNRGVVFLLAGTGPLVDKVKSSQSNSMIWVGRLRRDDVASLLLQCDALCLPSRSEGFSTTLLEASSCACPSIVTNVGGASELIPDNSYGQIIASPTASCISKAVINLVDNPVLRNLQSQNCLKHVDASCSWNSSAKELLDAFERVAVDC